MVSDVRGVETAIPDRVRKVPARGALSQWQLITRRFFRHRLAVASLFALFVLYSVALFAEDLAPLAQADAEAGVRRATSRASPSDRPLPRRRPTGCG